jgi:hypothetical protein
MRTFHCEQCQMTTSAAGGNFRIEHCSRCGKPMKPVGEEEAPAVTSATRFDAKAVEASFHASVKFGEALADAVNHAAPTPLDAAVMVGGVYLYFCMVANVHPVQFAEMLNGTVGDEIRAMSFDASERPA